jgi:hypothetical protein
MTIQYITYPLANAVQSTELLRLDDAFDRSIAGQICGLMPMTLRENTSLAWSDLSSILTYSVPHKSGMRTLSFETRLGQVNALLHADGSVNAAVVDAGPKGDRLLTAPLCIKKGTDVSTARRQIIDELTLWLEVAEFTAPAAWGGDTPCPLSMRAPWCDIYLGPYEAASVLVDTVFAALTIAHPSIPSEELQVSILGRQILPDGTITSPKMVMQRVTGPFGSVVDIEAPAIARIAELALRNMPGSQNLIAHDWDRLGEKGSVRLLPGVVASRDGHASTTLSAHEQIAAKDFLQEQAGLA